MNRELITGILTAKNIEINQVSEDALQALGSSAVNNNSIKEYLMHCTPKKQFKASDIYIYTFDNITTVNLTEDPFNRYFSFGFMSVAGTISGNKIVVNVSTEKVYFADANFYLAKKIRYIDSKTGELEETHDI